MRCPAPPLPPFPPCGRMWAEKGGDKMDPINQIAFDTTKELLIAKLGNSNLGISKDSGEQLAAMFEAVYTGLLKLAKDAEVK